MRLAERAHAPNFEAEAEEWIARLAVESFPHSDDAADLWVHARSVEPSAREALFPDGMSQVVLAGSEAVWHRCVCFDDSSMAACVLRPRAWPGSTVKRGTTVALNAAQSIGGLDGVLSPKNRLATRMNSGFLAEAVRFELTDPCGSAVFKTAGLNRSPKPPAPQL
jgi:hypothetical protein